MDDAPGGGAAPETPLKERVAEVLADAPLRDAILDEVLETLREDGTIPTDEARVREAPPQSPPGATLADAAAAARCGVCRGAAVVALRCARSGAVYVARRNRRARGADAGARPVGGGGGYGSGFSDSGSEYYASDTTAGGRTGPGVRQSPAAGVKAPAQRASEWRLRREHASRSPSVLNPNAQLFVDRTHALATGDAGAVALRSGLAGGACLVSAADGKLRFATSAHAAGDEALWEPRWSRRGDESDADEESEDDEDEDDAGENGGENAAHTAARRPGLRNVAHRHVVIAAEIVPVAVPATDGRGTRLTAEAIAAAGELAGATAPSTPAARARSLNRAFDYAGSAQSTPLAPSRGGAKSMAPPVGEGDASKRKRGRRRSGQRGGVSWVVSAALAVCASAATAVFVSGADAPVGAEVHMAGLPLRGEHMAQADGVVLSDKAGDARRPGAAAKIDGAVPSDATGNARRQLSRSAAAAASSASDEAAGSTIDSAGGS
eukprot:PRCOL_00003236-RA